MGDRPFSKETHNESAEREVQKLTTLQPDENTDQSATNNTETLPIEEPIEVAKPVVVDSKSNQKKKKKNKKIDMPASFLDEDKWTRLYDLGNAFAKYILDAFAIYASGDFASWDKNRTKEIEKSLRSKEVPYWKYSRNTACEYILIERMKEKDFFCCALCEMSLFNYKHALIHFNRHQNKETAAVRNSGVNCFWSVLKSITQKSITRTQFTDLPTQLFETDDKNETDRYQKSKLLYAQHKSDELFPDVDSFYDGWFIKYGRPVLIDDPPTGQNSIAVLRFTETIVESAKSEDGRMAMAELHDHLEQGETRCALCLVRTGDREGYYAHHTSYRHLETVHEEMKKYGNPDLLLETILINVRRQDLI